MRRMTNGDVNSELNFLLAPPITDHGSLITFSLLTVHFSSARRTADFSAAIPFPIQTSTVRSALNGSKSQRPATKLKSCMLSGKRTKPFARSTLLGRASAKPSKQSREKVLSELNVNDSNSG